MIFYSCYCFGQHTNYHYRKCLVNLVQITTSSIPILKDLHHMIYSVNLIDITMNLHTVDSFSKQSCFCYYFKYVLQRLSSWIQTPASLVTVWHTVDWYFSNIWGSCWRHYLLILCSYVAVSCSNACLVYLELLVFSLLHCIVLIPVGFREAILDIN